MPPKLGSKLSEEHKRKISEASKHRSSVSDETRKRMSEAQKGKSYNKGRHHSEEARRHKELKDLNEAMEDLEKGIYYVNQ